MFHLSAVYFRKAANIPSRFFADLGIEKRISPGAGATSAARLVASRLSIRACSARL